MSFITSPRVGLRLPCQLLSAALASIMLLAPAAPADAATLQLGKEELLRPLQDVALKNSRGEPLFVGYKVSFHWLGLPWRVSNDGYVLGVKGQASYYALDQARLAEWQSQGYLPSPLPPYRLSAADYALGNLLWIVLGVLSSWYALRIMAARRAELAAAVASEDPVAPPARTPLVVPRPSQAAAAAEPVPQPRLEAAEAPEPTPAVTPTAAAAEIAEPPAAPEAPMPPAKAVRPARIAPIKLAAIGKSPELAEPAPLAAPAANPAAEKPLATLQQLQPVSIPQAQVTRLPVAKTVTRLKVMKSA